MKQANVEVPTVTWNSDEGRLVIAYREAEILHARFNPRTNAYVIHKIVEEDAEAMPLRYSHGPKSAGGVPDGRKKVSLIVSISALNEEPIDLDACVAASADSFACIPEGGPEIMRGCIGAPDSLLNNGVFDRSWDWAVWADGAVAEKSLNTGSYRLKASGAKLVIKMAVGFLRTHRSLFHWNPDKKIWNKPVSGWCSWAAHWADVTENDILAASDLIAEELLPYGYEVIQIDDGFQRFSQGDPAPLKPGEKVADYWVDSNEKFPHGMKWMAERIASRGLLPGIWISAALPLGMPEDWYVKDEQGGPYRGKWVNWAVNGLNDTAVDNAYGETIKSLKNQGWKYFKIDTVRHVLYDNYRACPEYWKARNEKSELAFRGVFNGIRSAIGPDNYMLSCWGVIPEMAGIADGCRVGEDVQPDWKSSAMAAKYIAEFNWMNNTVWLNDPDYMCLRLPLEQGRSWASWVALSGSQLMISDPPEVYDEPRLDILRKTGPMMPVRPQTLRPFMSPPELWLLDLEKSGDVWHILGRFAWGEGGLQQRSVSFAELGISYGEYLVWDFWNERFVGSFKGAFPAEMLPEGHCRVWAIRKSLGRPQILSTNRHIVQGYHELSEVSWNGSELSGEIRLPGRKSVKLYVYVPGSWRLQSAVPDAAKTCGCVLSVEFDGEKSGNRPFSLRFAK